MKRTPTRWSIACLSLFLILGLTTGCKGRKARKAIEETQAARDQARDATAPKYARDIYNNASRLLTQAEQATNAGNHDEAIDLSQRAQAQFQQAIAIVPGVRSKIESLQNQIAEILGEIQQGIEQAGQEGVAEATLVAQLQTELEALQTRETELRALVNEDDFLAAIAQAEDLKKRSDLAKLAHLKPQADQVNTDIESLKQEIDRLDAKKYVPDELDAIQPQVEQLRNAYAASDWQAVIDSGAEVQTALQGIISETQQKAAADFVARAEEALAAAKAVEVSEIPEYGNLIGQAETAISQARTSLASAKHTEAFSAAEQVMTLVTQARDTLGSNVQRLLDSAAAAIEQAKQKEVGQYAPAELAATNRAIEAARQAQAVDDFVTAYARAKTAQQLASGLSTAALRGHARKELSAVQSRLQKARAEGADQYAQPTYGQVAGEVTQLEDLFKAGQFQQVINQAPGKTPRIDQIFTKLREGVQEVIARGDVGIALAKEAQAETWAADLLQQSQEALNRARSLLPKESYRMAASSAEEAAAKASEAEATAYRLRAEENLREADATLNSAERADSPTLSPLAYSNAKEIRQQAEQLLETREFKRGWEASVQAVETGEIALNHRVITAQEACDSALQAEARTYDREEIDQALALLNEAKAAQKAQSYDRANQTARQATALAAKAESFTWRQRSKQLLLELAASEQLMADREAQIHVPALARRFTVSFATARVKEIGSKWADCYQAAADARDSANAAWKEMTQQLQEKTDRLDEISRTIGNIALDDWGRQQKIDFLPAITEVRRLVKLEMFVEAFDFADQRLKQAEELLDQVQRHNLSVRAEQLSGTLDHLYKTGPAKILENRADEIRTLFSSLKNPGDKYDYNRLIAEADTAEEDLKGFPGEAQDNASQRTTQAYEILQQAEQAGARKYYRDRLGEASKDLQWLRNEVKAGDYNSIYEHLVRLEKEAPELLEDTTLAVAEDEYKQRLTANLTQMQNLIRDFDSIIRLDKRILIAARASETSTEDPMMRNAYHFMQRPLTARRFLAAAQLLEQNVIDDDPPETLNGLKEKAVESFRHLRKAAEGFEVFGDVDTYDIGYRSAAMEGAYKHLKKILLLNKEIEYIIHQERKDNSWERFDWKMRLWEDRIDRLIWRRTVD